MFRIKDAFEKAYPLIPWNEQVTELCTRQYAFMRGWIACQPEIDALQAKIDALMLEYCPDEMSKEQIAEWGRNQCAVEVDFMKGLK